MKTRLLIIIAILTLSSIVIVDNLETQYAHASCSDEKEGPCFGPFVKYREGITDEVLMNHFSNYADEKFVDYDYPNKSEDVRNNFDGFPAIVCYEIVHNDTYRILMAEWIENQRISEVIVHHDPRLCEKSLNPFYEENRPEITEDLLPIHVIPSPHKQFKNGAFYTDILCNEPRILKFRADTYQPVCIFPESENKMMHRDIVVSWTNPMPEPRFKHSDPIKSLPDEPCFDFWTDECPDEYVPAYFVKTQVGFIRDKSIPHFFKVTTPEQCHGTYEYEKQAYYEWKNGKCTVTNCDGCKKLFEKYTFASPIDQMKHGISIKDIRCNDGLLLNYKSDTCEPVCLTSEEESQLLREGKIKLRLFMPGTQVEVNLCKIYGGDIRSHSLGEGKDDRVFCDNLEFPLLCDMTGGSMRQDGNCSINHKIVYE